MRLYMSKRSFIRVCFYDTLLKWVQRKGADVMLALHKYFINVT